MRHSKDKADVCSVSVFVLKMAPCSFGASVLLLLLLMILGFCCSSSFQTDEEFEVLWETVEQFHGHHVTIIGGHHPTLLFK